MISKVKKFFIGFLLLLIVGFVILFFNVFNISFENGIKISLKEDYASNKIVMLVTRTSGNSFSASANPPSSKKEQQYRYI